jgi:hypothetical protein
MFLVDGRLFGNNPADRRSDFGDVVPANRKFEQLSRRQSYHCTEDPTEIGALQASSQSEVGTSLHIGFADFGTENRT